jgi:CelD/BcsL family acetyltransferase involved in cellulose biosynthesis
MLSIEKIDGAEVFDCIGDAWDDLAGRGMTDTPFQRRAYQRAWWNHLGPGELHTLVLRDDPNSPLAGLFCFYIIDGLVHFNGCVEETDYLDLIAPAEQAEFAWRAVLDYLTGEMGNRWHSIDLCNVPAWSPTVAILERLAPEYGLQHERALHEVCPVIELPDTFDEYLAALDKKQRHEVRRKLRRAAGADVVYEIVDQEDDLEKAVDDFLSLLERSTPEKGAWLNVERRAVFHEVAAAACADGYLQLMFVTVDGERAAALFNFAYGKRIWVYNSGLDPDSYGWLSAGVVLTAHAIEQAIEDNYDVFDFLRGDEEYKYRFGATDTEIFRISLSKSPQ